MTGTEFARRVQNALEPRRNGAQAEPMARYMKDRFPFLGLKRPELDELLRPLWPEVKPHATAKLLSTAAQDLWKLPEREYHYAAIDLLGRNRKALAAESLGLLRKLLESKSWWDSVDGITSVVVGPLVASHPELKVEMDLWSRDENFWVRRAAIIHQLAYRHKTDAARLFRYCASNAQDPEFFIRKAIGWALRHYARTDPDAVRDFVEQHPELSPLSKREALKHLSGAAGK